MHKYQQRGESLQELNFKFIELIQAFTNYEPEDITDPLKNCLYLQK